MHRQPHIQNINNAVLNTIHGVPLQIYGTDQSLERYEYQRKTPALGITTNDTQLQKKFYGNSTNRSASYIAERKRVNQIGIYSNTTPIQQINNDKIPTQTNALRRVRSSGCVLPKKCNNKPTTTDITPTFNGRSIATNPGNPGGHKWYNVTHNRWNKYCIAPTKNVVSGYYPDYVHSVLGTSTPVKIASNIPGGVVQSTGFAKTYTNIKNRYIFQPYNPSGF